MAAQTFDDNGVISFTPEVPGEHLLLLGAGATDDFDGGLITVEQDNIDFTELVAIDVPVRRIVWLRSGTPLNLTLSGAGASVAITCILERVDRSNP